MNALKVFKINVFILNAFLFIYRNCMEYIFMPFNLKIILVFSVHCECSVQFKILNRKCSFSIQLHPIESNWIQSNPKKSIRYLKYTFGYKKISIHSRLLDLEIRTRYDFYYKPRIILRKLMNSNGADHNTQYIFSRLKLYTYYCMIIRMLAS